MTKNYNVTTYGISEQLKYVFEKIEKTIVRKDKEYKVYDYKVPAKNSDGFVVLDVFLIDKLADIINDNIFNQYNSLQNIFNYFTKLAKILINLNLPIT